MVATPETGRKSVEESAAGVGEGVVIIDFGSQYSHLISRRARELKVYSEVVPASAGWERVSQRFAPRGVILSGGPASVYEPGAPLIPAWVFDRQLPVLGICYGMQALVHQLGGRVAPGEKREYGSAELTQVDGLAGDASIFSGMPSSFQVWMSHGDRVDTLPQGFAPIASTGNSPYAAISNGKNIFGLQFHPEVEHTPLDRLYWRTSFTGCANARVLGHPATLSPIRWPRNP